MRSERGRVVCAGMCAAVRVCQGSLLAIQCTLHEAALTPTAATRLVAVAAAAAITLLCSSPNVLSMASSLKDESSYSYLTDVDVGLSLIDRFTWSTLDFFERVDINSRHLTLADLVSIYK